MDKNRNTGGSVWTSENILYCEGDQTLAQIAQGGYGISIHGDSPKPPGHCPGKLALDSIAWAGWLDKTISRGPFQPEPFCDSKINNLA